MAGRSRSKLESVVERLDLTSASVRPDIVLADVGDAPSLLALACSTRVLISAVGPFRKYGTPVVKACIQGKCDYLDVCGEPGDDGEGVVILWGWGVGVEASGWCMTPRHWSDARHEQSKHQPSGTEVIIATYLCQSFIVL